MHRQITPTGKEQLDWINGTYGIGEAIGQFASEIVGSARKTERPPTERLLADILDEIDGISPGDESDWALTKRRFLEAGGWGKIQAIRALLMARGPTNRLRVNTRVFYGLSDGRLPVEVQLIYEIDLPGDAVAFYSFQHFSAATNDIQERAAGITESW